MRPAPRRWFHRAVLATAVLGVSCRCEDAAPEPDRGGPPPSASVVKARAPAPRALYLPDAASTGTAIGALPSAPGPALLPSGRCPSEMVDVRGEFCIDRYEAVLVERSGGRGLSPFYHPTPGQTRASFERWTRLAPTVGPPSARTIPVPSPPEWQLASDWTPVAAVRAGVTPQGYLNREVASRACRNAGKRLCTSEEWTAACRGHQRRRFPYGDTYEHGRCNVFRDVHPAAVLHGNASEGHLDPRLNQVNEQDDPLLRPTGGTPECRSEWGADAIYDMVGNLDEWVSDAGGVFVGGFFSRATREGCEARIEAHQPEYFDYSLGVRCCR